MKSIHEAVGKTIERISYHETDSCVTFYFTDDTKVNIYVDEYSKEYADIGFQFEF